MARLGTISIVLLVLLFLSFLCVETDGRRRKSRKRPNKNHRNRRNRHRHTDWWNQSTDDCDDETSKESDIHAPYSMLVMQWPESVCASDRRRCHGPIHPYWTIHGVWALNRRFIHCRADFDPNELNTIRANLTRLWPSFLHKTGDSFWKHEYDKHGSCLSPTISEYFHSSLTSHSRYAPELESALRPTLNTRSLNDWRERIKQTLAREPMLMCRTNWHPRGVSQRSRASPLDSLMRPSEVGSREILVGEEDESLDSDEVASSSGYETDEESSHPRVPSYRRSDHLLVEVGLCFDRSNQLVDCPVKGRLRGCRQDDPLLLPPVGTFETLSN